MGTDMYLSWDKQSEKEKEDRITGFSINAGEKGYIRASIGMTNENTVLRILFPNHWKHDDEKFDFNSKENRLKLEVAARLYLMATMTGKEVHHPDHNGAEEMGKKVIKMLGGLGFKEKNIESGNMESLSESVMWLNSLYGFYRLGMEKQEKGLNPRIRISW